MDHEQAKQRQDRRLRWSILRMLDNAKDLEGGMPGRRLLDVLDGALPPADRFGDDEARLLSLLKDLKAGGYAELLDTRTHRSQRYGLDYLQVSITAKGSRFRMGGEPPDALIDDGRIVRVDG